MWLFALGFASFVLARTAYASRASFERFALDVMSLFGRLWHGIRCNRPAPLPRKGGAIVVANHTSLADPAFLLASCPRFIHFLQAKHCYEVPLLTHLFRWAGCIPVARDGKDVRALRVALRQLQEGTVVGIFPDGEVDYQGATADGEARLGVAFLALRGHVPVIPAYISGGRSTRNLLHAWLWPTRDVRVTFGEPLDLSAYDRLRIDRPLLEEVTDQIMARVAELRPKPAPRVAPVAGYLRSKLNELSSDFTSTASAVVELSR